MLIPSPPIFQPFVVIRASTVGPSQAVTRMLASLVSMRSLAARSRLKLFVHSSVEADGKTVRSTTQIIQIMSHIQRDWRLPIADCRLSIVGPTTINRQSPIGNRQSDHSYLNTIIGSTLDARRAGTKQAPRATPIKSVA